MSLYFSCQRHKQRRWASRQGSIIRVSAGSFTMIRWSGHREDSKHTCAPNSSFKPQEAPAPSQQLTEKLEKKITRFKGSEQCNQWLCPNWYKHHTFHFRIWMLSRWYAMIPTRKIVRSALKPVEHTVCFQMPAISGNTQSREMEPPTSKWPAEH